MSSQPIANLDYRQGVGDKYGRRNCDSCGKFRRINAYWQDTNRVLCKECSHKDGLAFAMSVRATPNSRSTKDE